LLFYRAHLPTFTRRGFFRFHAFSDTFYPHGFFCCAPMLFVRFLWNAWAMGGSCGAAAACLHIFDSFCRLEADFSKNGTEPE
jgi:hypothetical protein